ncbi:MAG TPA: phosphoenolpyruvate--protein phosphotransferase [bacterium]|nr:phosphoenolpyruvate--protein phosphotransferase [bacterium]
MEIIHTANPVSLGIAIGKVLKFKHRDLKIRQYNLRPEDVTDEIIRFENAVAKSYKQIEEIRNKIKEEVGEENSKIFDVHLLILQDQFFINEVVGRIKTEQINCEYILDDVLRIISESFENLDNEIIRQRASDIYDVGRRILQNLTEVYDTLEEDFDEPVILVTEDLLPSDTLQIAKKNIVGFVTEKGGRTSHTAILARALKVPALIEADDIVSKVIDGETLIIDGLTGTIIQNPTPETIAKYQEKQIEYIESEKIILTNSLTRTKTLDDIKINFYANIEFDYETKDVINYAAEGIGLFRTEYLFMDKVRLPSENEQFMIYKNVAQTLPKNMPIVIRTLDIGGDKILLHHSPDEKEANPFLGLRAIRFCLENRDIFKTQLRAILRASAFGNIKILLPMIAFISEILKTRELIKEIQMTFDEEGIAYNKNIELGAMIEIPAAVIILEKIFKYVDFISIGTNDLIQYTLAVDRTNDKVNYLFQRLHPAVLQLLNQTITLAKKQNKPVTVCGDMAEIPTTAILLLGMGLTDFSMNPSVLPDIKTILTSISYEQAKKYTDDIMAMSMVSEIKQYILQKIKPAIIELIPAYRDADFWLV